MGVDQERLWRKKKKRMRMPANKMLRDAIIDVLPFDVDAAKANEILQIILDTIVKGMQEDRRVTINGLGTFYEHYLPPRIVSIVTRDKQGKVVKSIGQRVKPGYYSTRFMGCKSLRKSMDVKDDA